MQLCVIDFRGVVSDYWGECRLCEEGEVLSTEWPFPIHRVAGYSGREGLLHTRYDIPIHLGVC